MYACAEVIYGLDLTGKELSPEDTRLFERAIRISHHGYRSPYCGWNGPRPQAFGLSLGGAEEADEDYDEMGLEPGDTYVDEAVFGLRGRKWRRWWDYRKLVRAQSPELRAVIASLGKPSLFLLWSTS